MTLALLTHPACAGHEMGPAHPERPARLDAIERAANGLAALREEAPEVAHEALARVHDRGYLDALRRAAPRGAGLVWLDPDTALGPGTLAAASRAAGAAVRAVDLVLGGTARAAFCAVRPPGHHAERAQAMGFCFYNNVAVGAAHALAAHGLDRVAIADFDVHHGNGTEDIFLGDPRVLVLSAYQHPFYPARGGRRDVPHLVNVPLPAGTAGAAYRAAVSERWLPAIAAFRPQLVLFSAGFDAHRADPLADLALEDEDYGWVTREVLAAAGPAAGRAVSVLEGGYDLGALDRAGRAHLAALAGPAAR